MEKLIRDEMYSNTVLPKEGESGSGGNVDLTDYYKKPEVDGLLGVKADKTALDDKADKSALSAKADKTYVDTELGKKVNTGVSYTKAESDGSYAKKVDMTTELGKKADKTYVDTELGKKANTGVSYTKAETYLKSEVDALIKGLTDRIVILEGK